MSNLKDARNIEEQEHEDLVKKMWIEAKASANHVIAERNGVVCFYHGVSRSIQNIFKAPDECNASHSDKLTQLRLLYEDEQKMKAALCLLVRLNRDIMLQN